MRLEGSNSSSGPFKYGHVEICYGGFFGSVCDSGWDEVDSQVLCTQLGFLEGMYVRKTLHMHSSTVVQGRAYHSPEAHDTMLKLFHERCSAVLCMVSAVHPCQCGYAWYVKCMAREGWALLIYTV